MTNPSLPYRPTIAITPDVETQAGKRGPSTFFSLSRDYADAIWHAGGIPMVLPYTTDVDGVVAAISRVDGLLLTGGAFDVDPALFGEAPHARLGVLKPDRTQFEKALLQYADDKQMPTLGICGGMQLMNVYRGGDLYQDIPSQFASSVEHEQAHSKREPVHTVHVAENSILYRAFGTADILHVNSTHHQGVRQVGRDLSAVGHSAEGLVEAIEDSSRAFFVGVQWHPEAMADASGTRLPLYRAFVEAARRWRMHLPMLLFLLGVVGFSSACETELEITGIFCDVDADCSDGLICEDSICASPCRNGEDCPEAVCNINTGRCVGCISNSDCLAPTICESSSGLCVAPLPGCQSDADCGVEYCDVAKGVCLACFQNDHCSSGVCNLVDNTCEEPQAGCLSDVDCVDARCDVNTGICVACLSDADCPLGTCDVRTNTCSASCFDGDSSEPNNNTAQAFTLVSGSSHTGNLCGGDVDFFAVAITGDVHAVVTPASNTIVRAILLDSQGTALANAAPSGGAYIIDATALNGNYFIRIETTNSDDATDYLLTVDITTPVVCTQIDFEPNNTSAQAVAVGSNDSVLAGSLCGADVDFYRADVQANGSLSVEVDAALSVQVQNSAGTTIATGTSAQLSNLAAGSYFVRVSGPDNSTYNMRIRVGAGPPPCVERDVEPNDTTATALALVAGTDAVGNICSSNADIYRFNAAALDDVRITMTGNVRARLERLSDNARIVEGVSPLNAVNLNNGGYQLVIEANAPATSSEYTVSLVVTPEPVADPCLENGLEPDDSIIDANALTADGIPVQRRICASDQDFFAITIAENSVLTLQSLFVDANGDLDMQLLDASGTELESSEGVTDEENIERELPAGVYYVRIFGFLGAANTYSLSANAVARSICTADDDFETNNTFATAVPLRNGVVSATHCPADDDFYALTLTSGDAVSAQITSTDGTLEMQLVSSSGTVLASGRSISTGNLAAGDYALRVTGRASQQSTYSVNYTATPSPARACVDDGAEDNNNLQDAYVLSSSGLADGIFQVGLLQSCPNNEDFFAIDVPANKELVVNVDFDFNAFDLDLTVLEEQGTSGLTRVLGEGFSFSRAEEVTGIVNAAGRVYIQVSNFAGLSTPYTLRVIMRDAPTGGCIDDKFDTFVGSGDDEALIFDNDDAFAATQVRLPETLRDQSICAGNADWYRVSLSSGQSLTVVVTYTHSTGRDIDVRAYGPSSQSAGSQLISKSGVSGEERFTLTATTTGTHFVEVFGFNSGENDYTISFASP